ncbi:hypothetical protein [Bacteriovorax sp. Seq25_V]|uniref:hypothetical protein n=1 Tax=Bacteriovorax sp. Seq25_V TaxID=1201288 RepID=UPI00038A3759|nr:hypothetical protein [Bacteriovorax sp. Seq25_V]EQC44338.1 hypothetical protein M900_A0383 [Bacteriovorax sp. Seq25_V]
MTKFLKLIPLIVLFASCDLKAPEKKSDDTEVSGNEALKISDNRVLNDTEISYAKKICQALENKTEFFNRLVGESRRYTFMRRSSDCGSTERRLSDHSVSITAPARYGDPLNFEPVGNKIPNFTYSVYTHEDSSIKETCDQLLSGSTDIPKLIQPLGNDYIKYRFYANDTFEYFIYLKNGDKWYAKRFESIKVIHSNTSDNNGIVSQRIFGGYCPNGKQSYTLQQLL